MSDPLRQHLRDQAPPWYDRAADTWQRPGLPASEPRKDAASSGIDTALLVDALAWFLIALLIAGVVFGLLRLLGRRRPAVRMSAAAAPRANPARIAAVAQLDLGEAREPEEALAAARAAGDWARAMVWLYALLLVRLDGAGAVRVRRGATNRQYAREARRWARASPALDQVLGAVIGGFERVHFGTLPADAALVDGLEQRVRALEL